MECDLPGCRRKASHEIEMQVAGILLGKWRLCTTHKDKAVSSFSIRELTEEERRRTKFQLDYGHVREELLQQER